MSDPHRPLHCPNSEVTRDRLADSGETDEWNAMNNNFDLSFDRLSGKIVARLPDLGECKAIPGPSLPGSGETSGVGTQTKRIFQAGWSSVGRVFAGIVPSNEAASDDLSRHSLKPLYSRLIGVGAILLLCGLFLIVRGSKKSDDIAKDEPKSKVDVISKDTLKTTEEKSVEKPKKPAPKANPDKSPEAKKAKSATKVAASKEAAAKVAKAKQAPETAPGDGSNADKKSASLSVAASSVTHGADVSNNLKSNVSDDRNVIGQSANVAHQKNENSPWDRDVMDNYSPWTMSSSQRLDAAAENAAKREEEIPGVAVSPNHSPVVGPGPASPRLEPSGVIADASGRSGAFLPGMTQSIPQSVVPQSIPQSAVNQAMHSGGFASSSQYSSSHGSLQYNAAPRPMPPNMPGAVPNMPYPPSQTAMPVPYGNVPQTATRKVTPIQGRIPIAEATDTYQSSMRPTYPPAPAYPATNAPGVYAAAPSPGMYAVAPTSVPTMPNHAAPNYVASQPYATGAVPTSHPMNAAPQNGVPQTQHPAIVSPYQQTSYQQKTYPVPAPGPVPSHMTPQQTAPGQIPTRIPPQAQIPPQNPMPSPVPPQGSSPGYPYSTVPSAEYVNPSYPGYQQGSVPSAVPTGRIY